MPRKSLAYWAATLAFVALVLSKFSPQSGLTGLIRFGQSWEQQRLGVLRNEPIAVVPNSSGYDGQFYAQIAIDPTLRDPGLEFALDAPAYRSRRILAPAAAHLLGWGRPRWVLEAYALLNVACWFATAWLLLRAIGGNSLCDFARWFGCMFSVGALDSVRQSLVDLPAVLFLLLACTAKDGPTALRTNLLLTLGNLTKETNILGAFALHLGPTSPRRWGQTAGLLAATILPLAAWLWYVQHRFQAAAGAAGLGNFDWPLVGAARHIAACAAGLARGDFDGRYSMGFAAVVGLGLQAWVLWRHPNLSQPWWRVGAAYSLLLLFLGSWVWSGYWAAQRAVLPMTFAFNLLLPANRWFWPTWVLANLTILHAIWRFL